jgi:hypothetical protein
MATRKSDQTELLMQLLEAQKMQAQSQGAITGQGIRNWGGWIQWILGGLVALCIGLVVYSSAGTEKYLNITNQLDRHERAIEALSKKTNSLDDDKVDRKEFQVYVAKIDRVSEGMTVLQSTSNTIMQSVREMQLEQDKSSGSRRGGR